jgi:hypothetical protein
MGLVAIDGGSTSVTSASSHDMPVQPAPTPQPNAQQAAALAALKAALQAAQEARTREAQQAAAEKVKAAMENAMRAYADGKTGSARTAALADAGAAIGKLAPSGGDAGKLFSSLVSDATQSVSAETPALSSVREDAFAVATAQDKLKQDQADLAALRKLSPKLAAMDQQEGGAQALSDEQRHIDQLQQTVNTAVEHEYDTTQAPSGSKDPDSARLAIVLGNHANDGVQGDLGSLLSSHMLHDEMAHPQTAGLTDADKQILKNDPLSFAVSSLMARNPDDSSLQLSLLHAASAMRPSYAHDLIAKAPDLTTKLSVLNAQMAAAEQTDGAAGRKAVLDAAGSDVTPQALEKALNTATDATQPFQIHAGPQASPLQQKATNAGEWLSSTLANGCPNELRASLLDALTKHLGKDAPDISSADNIFKTSFFNGVSTLVSGDPASAKKAAQWLLASRGRGRRRRRFVERNVGATIERSLRAEDGRQGAHRFDLEGQCGSIEGPAIEAAKAGVRHLQRRSESVCAKVLRSVRVKGRAGAAELLANAAGRRHGNRRAIQDAPAQLRRRGARLLAHDRCAGDGDRRQDAQPLSRLVQRQFGSGQGHQ